MTDTKNLSKNLACWWPISLLIDGMKTKHHQILGNKKLTCVSIEELRCQEKPFSQLQGFSGKEIDHFPPCKFFRKYQKEPVLAQELFAAWLRECLLDMQAFKTPSSEGGWADGSLMREITQAHKDGGVNLERFEDAQPGLVETAIARRVAHYFALFNSVKHHGYNRLLYPPIRCLAGAHHYFIENGHHRVAALRVLGYQEVEILVLHNA